MARKTAPQVAILDPAIRVLLLLGAEAMLKLEHLEQLRESLRKVHGEVETFVFDGRSTPLAEVLDELRTFSLMQAYKLVIVDEADAFVKSHREAMERYVQAPVENATLVLRSLTWNPGKLDKLIEAVGVKIKCEPLSLAEAKPWLIRRAQSHHEAVLEPKAADLLLERLGTELTRLDSELAKLAATITKGGTIRAEAVDQMVARASDEKAWAVQEAVLDAMAQGSAGKPSPSAAGPAIEKVHELVDLSAQAEALVTYFVADLVRKLYLARLMLKQGSSERAIGEELKIFPFELRRKFMQVLHSLGDSQVAVWFDSIIDLDRKSKTGVGDPLHHLESFCAGVATGSLREL